MFDEIDNPETSIPITTQIRNRVEECFVKAESFYGEKIPRATISFDLTGTKGGTSFYAKRILRFNPKLAAANPDEYIKIVAPHEVAHFVQRWKYGYAANVLPHGREWQKIMIEIFRLSPKVTHRMDVSKVKRKTKQFIYTCGCPGRKHPCGQIRHNKIKKNAAQYKCKYCLQTITFEGKAKTLDAAKPKGMMSSEELD
jgi:SprT protein